MSTRIISRREIGVVAFVVACPIMFLLTGPFAFGQTDSAFGFFPLNPGDVHQFHYYYSTSCTPPYSTHYVEQVMGDTLLPTGFLYHKIGLQYVRIDSVSANVYRYEFYPSPHDVLMDSLRARPGSTFRRDWGYPTQCQGIDTLTVFGVRTTVKRFRGQYVFGEEYALAYGFGLIRRVTYDEDPCYPLLFGYCRDLVYAKINGQEFGTLVGVDEEKRQTPLRIELEQNYPNPFNPATTIQYAIPAEAYGRTSLRVLDVLGREVGILVNEFKQAGSYKVTWDGSGCASGVYYYRLQTGGLVLTRKMILVR